MPAVRPPVVDKGCQIKEFPDGFPPELVRDILVKFVKHVEKDSDCYEEFLRHPEKSSKFLRKMLLHQECRHLSEDSAITEYAKKALEFHNWLGPFGISFGSLHLLELVMPSNSAVSAHFCKAFAVSGIVQLNLDCDEDREDFLDDVLTWREGLAKLEVLRIKYRPRMTQEAPSHLYPWYKPQWLEMLSLSISLKVLALSTYLPLYEDPMDPKWDALTHPEIAIVEDWSQGRLPSLERVYLCHGRDEFSPISSIWSFGENVLLELKKPDEEITRYSPSRWNLFHVITSVTHRREPNQIHGESAIREEDVDFYATTDSGEESE
ncbi:hypothetical protein GALMADRAFT_134100 [Galerina marginata CBS 339.88]|uniref:Uncharacterized protein n=1 Tax=Galerina marginata (strain CBS 339.88) TaxID=685588 RepID=A0A067TJL2_GALM3|nr:hypothetical protein GALMADRAFT_134100 [Galerina marginata CBS 339.88]